MAPLLTIREGNRVTAVHDRALALLHMEAIHKTALAVYPGDRPAGSVGKPIQRAAQGGDAGEGGGSLPHELVGRATQKATQLLCAATGRHANGLQQAMAPVRRNLRPSLAKDLRELHVADAVCRHATAERFGGLVSELQESLGEFTDPRSTTPASAESGEDEASTGNDGASNHQAWCTDDQKSELNEVEGDLPYPVQAEAKAAPDLKIQKAIKTKQSAGHLGHLTEKHRTDGAGKMPADLTFHDDGSGTCGSDESGKKMTHIILNRDPKNEPLRKSRSSDEQGKRAHESKVTKSDKRVHAAVVIQAVARGRIARQGCVHLQTVFQRLKGTRSKQAASKVLKDVLPVVTAAMYCFRLPTVHEAYFRACRECALRHGLDLMRFV